MKLKYTVQIIDDEGDVTDEHIFFADEGLSLYDVFITEFHFFNAAVIRCNDTVKIATQDAEHFAYDYCVVDWPDNPNSSKVKRRAIVYCGSYKECHTVAAKRREQFMYSQANIVKLNRAIVNEYDNITGCDL